jgi:hypothetical protein
MNQNFNIYVNCRKKHGIYLFNEVILIKVVSIWFRYFEYVIDIYEKNSFEFSNLLNDNVKKSIFNALEKKSKINHKENKLKNFFSLFLYILFVREKGVISGGSRSKFNTLNFFLLNCKLKNTDIQLNNDFKDDFLIECQKYYSKEMAEIVREIIPNEFFSESFSENISLPKYIIGSPVSFLDFNGIYLRLLLQPFKLKLVGFQHGGAYGEWMNNEIESFEKSVCNEYYGWGLMDLNIIQNKYKRYQRNNNGNSIFWIGRDLVYASEKTNFHSEMNEHFLEFDHINFFRQKLIKFSILFMPHPRSGVHKYSSFFSNDEVIKFENTEYGIARFGKLVIFDCLSHSLLYFCIYNKIPFIILLKFIPLNHLTIKAKKFYLFLAEKQVLFEEKEFSTLGFNLISNYLDGKTIFPFDEDLFNEISSFLQSS